MIWEPFVLALVLGLVVSAGIYFAYLWPSVEPLDDDEDWDDDRATGKPEKAAAEKAADEKPGKAADGGAVEKAAARPATDDEPRDEDTPLPPPEVAPHDEIEGAIR